MDEDEGQLFVCEKSPGSEPVKPMLAMVSGPLPVFESITFCAVLDVEISCGLKVKLGSEKFTPGDVPVPDSGIDWGEPLVLSVTVMLAVRRPVAVGLKSALIVQKLFGEVEASVAGDIGQLLAGERAKSPVFAPVIAMLEIESEILPLFVSVMGCAPVATPTFSFVNVSEVGEKTAPGAAATS